ncbi:receptor-like protein kinase FERONIA [Durio zibethinus]|uniref:Receptor-like protein kinase FERONIA n=1 Tax=Durio zibethinus TaxID=66656 RepID=A0A6P5XF73_DURZI|nr:receptor-like protein kinase FERONIA [Durio zibethinus]
MGPMTPLHLIANLTTYLLDFLAMHADLSSSLSSCCNIASMKKITNSYASWPSLISLLHLSFFFNSWNCFSSSDQVILDCGYAGNSSFNGKTWIGDVNLFPDYYEETRIGRVISNITGKVPENPYATARFFPSSFTYSFPMSPGLKFIRLHFYPTSYTAMDQMSRAEFSVTSGNYTFLNNFSSSVMASILKSPYFTKDFLLNLKKQSLNITFAPSPHVSDAFAFVNGIEIYSMSLKLSDYGVKETSNATSIQDESALEILHRINVGSDSLNEPFWIGLDDQLHIQGSRNGTPIEAYDDHIDYNKSSWTLSEYGAPGDLYSTARTIGGSDEAANVGYNLTWTFPVDSGFKYIVRLHFCEIQLYVTEVKQRVFNVYINNKTVESSLDIVSMAGGPLVAMHRDYIITVSEMKEGRNDLWLALATNTDSKPQLADVILNGVEILKLSDTSNNLAAHAQVENRAKTTLSNIFLGLVLGIVFGICLVSLIVYLVSHWISKRYEKNLGKTSSLNVKSSDHCRQIPLQEIRAATNNFSEALVLGCGGFGKVYEGLLEDGFTKVAVKRKNPESHQGIQEFKTEIELLSTFRHMNIVSLLGYCQEDSELILIYDYMAHGTLRDHLYGTQNPPLSWTQRLKICIGAARGLHYLHTGTEHSIIHRDIKSTNILLDQDWVAKVSDFGLSKVGKTARSFRNQVSSGLKGTFGYLDPEYGRNRTLTRKSDVYSFGVVLFEVLCARPAVNREPNEDDQTNVSLARWAVHCYRSEKVDVLIEPYLRGKIMSECLTTFVDIAVRCLASRQIDRPSISDVLCKLEQALLLQEKADGNIQIKDA